MFRRLAAAMFTIAAACASAAAQERQWSLISGNEDAYLMFGVPDSDDVGISLWCRLHTGEVNIFVAETDYRLKPGRTVTVTVTAGKTVARLKGRTTPNEDAASIGVEMKVSASHSIFPALLAADRFKIKAGREEIVFPLIEADLAGLLALCRKA